MLSDSSGARSEGGRLFQVVGPNTAKLRWPVEVRTLDKKRVPVVAESKLTNSNKKIKVFVEVIHFLKALAEKRFT